MKLYSAYMLMILALAACSGGSPVNQNAPATTAAPPPVVVIQQQPPPPVVDDAPAIQARLNRGGIVQLDARTYHLEHTLMMTVSNTTLQGKGSATILEFVPTDTPRHCATDRAISTRCALSSTAPLGVALPIKTGDTSFVAINESDTANLSAGDWVLISNFDPGIRDANVHTSYATSVDWVQVAYVAGATVNLSAPFRQPFSSPFPFVSNESGVAFQKILVTQNITVQDLTVDVQTRAVGISILSTLDAAVRRVTVTSRQAQPLYTEYSKGATFENNIVNGGNTLDEFATSVDVTIRNNTFNFDAAPAIGLDLGTAFFTVTGNTITKSGNAAIYALYNVHNGTISDNVIGPVLAVGGAVRSLGILLEGSPYITVTGNTLNGGAGTTSVGIYVAPFMGAKLPEPTTGDVVSGNIITGFVTQVSN